VRGKGWGLRMAAGDYVVVSLCPVCAAPIYGPRRAVPPGYDQSAAQVAYTCQCWTALQQRAQSEADLVRARAALAWHEANAAAPEAPSRAGA
jgi:hypothetical protein